MYKCVEIKRARQQSGLSPAISHRRLPTAAPLYTVQGLSHHSGGVHAPNPRRRQITNAPHETAPGRGRTRSRVNRDRPDISTSPQAGEVCRRRKGRGDL